MLSNVAGFDDAPFRRGAGTVAVVGAVYARDRLEGVLRGEVTEDGDDATPRLVALVRRSRFDGHLQALMIQGLTLGGFNVVDIGGLARRLARPVIAVVRTPPDMAAVREALLARVPDGERKWRELLAAGPMHAAGPCRFQCAGIEPAEARGVIARFTWHGHIPEPLRTAHLIAGALVDGQSRGRV